MQFHEEINGLNVQEQTQSHYMKYTKGHNYAKTESRVTVFFFFFFLFFFVFFTFFAHRLIMPYTCTKFHEKILKTFKVIERTMNFA